MSEDECKTYLGTKGYSIYKDKISVKEQQYIRDQLMVRPYVPKAPVQPQSFPIYLESPKKLYVPRYFGEELYGKPDEYRIGGGDDINLEFKGELRDFQKDVVNKFLKSVDDDTGCGFKCGGGLLDIPCGFGKCLSLDTPIMMYDGTIKMVQDVKVGDQLMGDDSTPRNVLSLARGREMMYDVIPNKGDTYTVNQSHILSLKCSTNFNKKYRKGEVYDIPLLDYLDLPKSFHGRAGPLLGYRVGVEFEPIMIELEPYALGYWLGDGTCANSQITTEEDCVVKYFKDYADTIGCSVTQGKDSPTTRHSLHYNIVGKMIDGKRQPNKMLKMLQGYDLIMNKHIPDDFKYNSRKVQLELLAGIIDSDGSNAHNSYDIIQKNETLMDDIIYLVRSLGFAAYKKECKKSCMYKGEKKVGTYYRTNIHGKGLEEIPVKCERKKVEPRKQIKDALVTRIKIEPVGVDNYYGFELDGNHRYLLGDFTVTHNTVMGINIISKIKKKTLIIVHKTFLLNQWIERIEQFLPDAKVGSIQGQVIDIEGKDIVIGMLQSLSMKSYPSDLFSCFGLTICDETHHLGSEVFSQALQKIVTPVTLGLSATMQRKDGLTNVFKMFLGEIVYKMKRESEDKVLVKGIIYNVEDQEYNEVKYDWKGNPLYSSMISKVCGYSRRTEFILSVLKQELAEKSGQQIMVLAQQKNILVYLDKAIRFHNIASVGFYVGGMKEVDLKETENKTIVLATYAMAAEGLDIKTLTSMILASPRTDITQSVGRILRVKHERPLVVDIIDSHDVFKRQWEKRLAFYKKNKYKVIKTTNDNYKNDSWETIYDKEIKVEKKKKENACMVSL